MKCFEWPSRGTKKEQAVQQVTVVKSEYGEVLVEQQWVQQRWKEYIEDLLNQENPRERREVCEWKLVKEVEEVAEEVKTVLKKMKKGKARGPDDIPVEV